MVAVAGPRYEVVCRLASGGMAELHLARSVGMAGFERLVVIKRLSLQLATNPQAMQMLFDEARIAASLSHANIVSVNDVEVVDGQVSIVMEFLHGHDVAHLLQRLGGADAMLPLDQAIAIVLGVCAGLHHAHERMDAEGHSMEIVHRDVSPHNVFVTYDGAVKLIDFGIARATSRRGHTDAGVIKGKPGYIAPEQLRSGRTDRRSDVWGAGVLLYQMTTGALPFGSLVGMDEMVAVATTDPPPPRTTDYPPDLAAIVMRAIARDPDERYPTAEALRLDLEGFARSHHLDLSPFRIAALMEHVFGPQLEAWRRAQREGRSLAEHVAAFRDSVPVLLLDLPKRPSMEPEPEPVVASEPADIDADDTVQSLEAITPTVEPPKARRWRLVLMVAASPFLLLAGLALWDALDSSKRHAVASPIVEPAASPAIAAPPTLTVTPLPEVAPPADAAPAIEIEMPVDPPVDVAPTPPPPHPHPSATPTRHPPPARPHVPSPPAAHPAPPLVHATPPTIDPDAPLPR